jgi:hypothetical protein
MTEHPITPPPELVRQWFLGAKAMPVDQWVTDVATQAAQWGADQELEACCEWLKEGWDEIRADKLRAARRPKPPSLKEQALEQLDGIATVFRMTHGGNLVCDTIRRALQQLDD